MPTIRCVSIRAVGVLLRLCVAVGLLLFATGEALAQDNAWGSTDPQPPVPEFGTPAGRGPDHDVGGTRNFGVADGIDYWAGNADFVSRDGTPIGYFAAGYIFNNGGTPGLFSFWAPLHLPQGALLIGLRLYHCDTNAGANPSVALTAYEGDTSPTTNDLFIFTTTPSTPGCTSEFFATDSGAPGSGHTIDLRTPDRHYVLLVNTKVNNNTIRWKGVRAFWFRQLSPAPAAATFNDVPTTHGFFQFIEALADAGITGGCGGGNYCPNDPVTRGQMAVFLSRALGLHWPP